MVLPVSFLFLVLFVQYSTTQERCLQNDNLDDALNQLLSEMTNTEESMNEEAKLEINRYRALTQMEVSVKINEGDICRDFYEFNCRGYNDICIPFYLMCDGFEDCPGGSDEGNCESWIRPGEIWKGTSRKWQTDNLGIDYYHVVMPELQFSPILPGLKFFELEASVYHIDGSLRLYPFFGFYHFGEHKMYWRSIADYDDLYGVLTPLNDEGTVAREDVYYIATAAPDKRHDLNVALTYHVERMAPAP